MKKITVFHCTSASCIGPLPAASGQYNWPQVNTALGQYDWPQVNIKAIPIQLINNI